MVGEIYLCEICGNEIHLLKEGKGQLVCCGKPMKKLEEQTEETGKEKHLPVVEETDEGIMIKVGEIEHPMEENHYIEWIEVITKDGKYLRQSLSPGIKPRALFKGVSLQDISKVREVCNIHGLWSKEGPRQ